MKKNIAAAIGRLFGKKSVCVVPALHAVKAAARRDGDRRAEPAEFPRRSAGLFAPGSVRPRAQTLDEMIEGLSGLRGLNVKEREEAWADDRFGA